MTLISSRVNQSPETRKQGGELRETDIVEGPGPQASVTRPVGLLGGLRLIVFAALFISLLECGPPSSERGELLVFAATSLTDALTDVARAFEEQSATGVVFSYGGSQMLARQIASGAPADVFIAAGEFPVQFLADKGMIEPEATDLLSNKLVLVTRSDDLRLETLEQLNTDAVERIAVANPELAPAGRYARESLTHLGLWDELRRKLVLGPDVRVTLAYLESGNVDVAIVYRTDARIARGVSVLDIVPSESYSRIVYPAVVVRRSHQRAHAAEFLKFLRGEAASAIFQRHGFDPVNP